MNPTRPHPVDRGKTRIAGRSLYAVVLRPLPAGLLAGAIAIPIAISILAGTATAGSLTGSLRMIPENSAVNLSTNGTLDWIHWGLYTETSLNRKADVTPQISDFALLDNTNGFVVAWRFDDNYNGYTWTDGDPIAGVTNTTTGMYAYGVPPMGTGFQFTAPAGTYSRTLKVYCGVFAGTGRFEAHLSDGSAPVYSTTFANIPSNGESREVTLRYAADSPNQSVIVRWTLLQPGGNAAPNVTLQAAALSGEGPIVRLTGPSPDSNIAAPADVSLSATAWDLAGSISKVEFFANGMMIGQATSSPYDATWSSPAPGRYTLTAVATDDSGETMTSSPVGITVHGAGGTLEGSAAFPPQAVNLTAEGTGDWQHWGQSSSNIVNRKAGIVPSIGELDLIGSTDLNTYMDNYSAYSWTDGTPVATASAIRHGVFLYGLGSGFELAVPADTTSRTLRVYAGLYGSQGHFQAWLTDLSAPSYHSHSLSNYLGNDYGVFTLNYAAASAGQSLVVRYVAEKLFDSRYGNVTIQAATLQGGDTTRLVQIVNPIRMADDFLFSFQTQSGRSYDAQWIENLGGDPWNTFATIPGTGELVTVTNSNTTGTRRYYRVETK